MRKLVFCWIWLLLTLPCGARTITVDDDGPADFNNIQAAIDDSNNGDVVVVFPGTYTGEGNREINFMGKAITVRSTDPNDPCVVAATVVDCKDTSGQQYYGFAFWSGESANTFLDGLTITGALDGNIGGGVNCGGSSPTIRNCIIRGNYGRGGGINCSDSSPTISNCIIAGNQGGAIRCLEASPVIIDCTITGNDTFSWGGAIYCRESYPTIINCLIAGNWAQSCGGGIHSRDSNVTIRNCTIATNSAPDGNAISCDSYNQASPSTLQLTNCIIRDGSNGIWNNDGSTITIIYSDVQGSWPGLGNINEDPCFVDPGKWVDANDPNVTVEPNDPNAVWVDGDYHLKSEGWRWDKNFDPPRWKYDYVTSRCIDAGNPGSPLGDELLTIPNDPTHTWGENLRINMGAYGGTAQASMPPYDWALLADITNDGIVNASDFAHQASDWLINGTEQPGDFDRNGIVDTNDVGLFVADWLKTTSWHE